jgi:hypothetical protein
LYFPANTFAAGKTYAFQITVTSSGGSNQAIVVITIHRGPLVAALAGGDRVVAAEKDLVLDGRKSYDSDEVASGSSGLTFLWNCARVSGAVCGSAMLTTLASATTAQITIPFLSLEVTGSNPYIFTVTAFKDIRNSSASIQVTTTIQVVPTVSIIAPPKVVNADARVVMAGSVSSAGKISLLFRILLAFSKKG